MLPDFASGIFAAISSAEEHEIFDRTSQVLRLRNQRLAIESIEQRGRISAIR